MNYPTTFCQASLPQTYQPTNKNSKKIEKPLSHIYVIPVLYNRFEKFKRAFYMKMLHF